MTGFLNISISSLMAGFIFGVIGLWMFKEGRRTQHIKFIVIGILLIGYPYFTNNPWQDWGIGIVLCVLAAY